MTLTLTTSLTIMIVADLLLLIWAVTRDDHKGIFLSPRVGAMLLWILFNLIAWPIYGGIYWW